MKYVKCYDMWAALPCRPPPTHLTPVVAVWFMRLKCVCVCRGMWVRECVYGECVSYAEMSSTGAEPVGMICNWSPDRAAPWICCGIITSLWTFLWHLLRAGHDTALHHISRQTNPFASSQTHIHTQYVRRYKPIYTLICSRMFMFNANVRLACPIL